MDNKPISEKPTPTSQINDLVAIWLHAMEAIAQTPSGYRKFTELEHEVSLKWLNKLGFKFEKQKTPFESVKKFADFFNATYTDRSMRVEKIGEIISVTMEGVNPFNKVHAMTQKKGMKIFSFRAANLLTCIKEMTGQVYRGDMVKFEEKGVSVLNLLPLEVGINAVVSPKLAKGTVKISDSDLIDLGLGIIDEVKVTHAKSGKFFTSISYSSSKLPKGTILVSFPDAKKLGLKESDKVLVEKAGKEAVAELVEEKEYKGEYGFSSSDRGGGR
jgi:hypothetical protein